MKQILAIDGKSCESAFIRSGRDPDHLARFLKKYPAAFHLSWVQPIIIGWHAKGISDNLKLLEPSRGQRKDDTGLKKVFTDLLIYRAVTRMIGKGYKLTSSRNSDGIFHMLKNTSFNGKYLSESRIKDRYYSFCNHRPATFIDNDGKIIMGPTRVQIAGFDGVGFWRYTPNGENTIAK
jgi:hypothetical protein